MGADSANHNIIIILFLMYVRASVHANILFRGRICTQHMAGKHACAQLLACCGGGHGRKALQCFLKIFRTIIFVFSTKSEYFYDLKYVLSSLYHEDHFDH